MNIIKFLEYNHGTHEGECTNKIWYVIQEMYTKKNIKEN